MNDPAPAFIEAIVADMDYSRVWNVANDELVVLRNRRAMLAQQPDDLFHTEATALKMQLSRMSDAFIRGDQKLVREFVAARLSESVVLGVTRLGGTSL